MTLSTQQHDTILNIIDIIRLARDKSRYSRENLGYDKESNVETLLNQSKDLLFSVLRDTEEEAA